MTQITRGVSSDGWPILDPETLDYEAMESVDYMDDPAWKRLSNATRTAYGLKRLYDESEAIEDEYVYDPDSPIEIIYEDDVQQVPSTDRSEDVCFWEEG